MKKTLIALAVLATSGAAMAQSTFTLYGVADANLERVKGGSGTAAAPGLASTKTNSVNRVSSGGLNGSRWGLRGSEDLGGGLKAVFQLESGFDIDTGTSGQGSRLFGRQAFVGFEGGFGSVRLGRQYTPIGNLSDMAGTKPYDILALAGTYGAAGGSQNTNINAYRTDNALTYKTPSFSGFTVEAQYSTQVGGAETNTGTSAKQGRHYGFNAIFANGPISAGLGYIQIQDVNAALAESQKRNEVLLVGGYDFAVTKLTGFYSQTQGGTAATQDSKKMKVYGLTAAFPFGAATVTPGIGMSKDVTGVSASTPKDDVKFFTLQGTYDLSKRTALYTHIALVSNDAGAAKGFNAPNFDQSSNGIQVGVRHRF